MRTYLQFVGCFGFYHIHLLTFAIRFSILSISFYLIPALSTIALLRALAALNFFETSFWFASWGPTPTWYVDYDFLKPPTQAEDHGGKLSG